MEERHPNLAELPEFKEVLDKCSECPAWDPIRLACRKPSLRILAALLSDADSDFDMDDEGLSLSELESAAEGVGPMAEVARMLLHRYGDWKRKWERFVNGEPLIQVEPSSELFTRKQIQVERTYTVNVHLDLITGKLACDYGCNACGYETDDLDELRRHECDQDDDDEVLDVRSLTEALVQATGAIEVDPDNWVEDFERKKAALMKRKSKFDEYRDANREGGPTARDKFIMGTEFTREHIGPEPHHMVYTCGKCGFKSPFFLDMASHRCQ